MKLLTLTILFPYIGIVTNFFFYLKIDNDLEYLGVTFCLEQFFSHYELCPNYRSQPYVIRKKYNVR